MFVFVFIFVFLLFLTQRTSFSKDRSAKPKIAPFKSLEQRLEGSREDEHSSSSSLFPFFPPSFSSSPSHFADPYVASSPESVTESLERTNFMKLMLSVPQMSIFEGSQGHTNAAATGSGDDILAQFRKVRDDFEVFSEDVAASCLKQSGAKESGFERPFATAGIGRSQTLPPVATQNFAPLRQPSPIPFVPPPGAPAQQTPILQTLGFSPQSRTRLLPETGAVPAGIPIAVPKQARAEVDPLREEEPKKLDLRDFGFVHDTTPSSDSDEDFGSSTEEIFPIQELGPRTLRKSDDDHALMGIQNSF